MDLHAFVNSMKELFPKKMKGLYVQCMKTTQLDLQFEPLLCYIDFVATTSDILCRKQQLKPNFEDRQNKIQSYLGKGYSKKPAPVESYQYTLRKACTTIS